MARRGSSLIEALLAMCLFSLIGLAGLEAFSAGRRVFFKMDADEERDSRAAAGMDRAKLDIREAGRGLGDAIRRGLAAGIAADENGFMVACLEREAAPATALAAGNKIVPLADPDGLAAGRTVCLLSSGGGEIGTIAKVLSDGIELAAPLARDYPGDDASLLLLRTVEILWNRKKRSCGAGSTAARPSL